MGDRGVCVISGFASFLGSVVSCWRLPCFALPCVCGGSRSLFAVVFRGGHLAPCGSRGVLRGCLIVLLFLSPRPPSFSFATGVFGLSAWGHLAFERSVTSVAIWLRTVFCVWHWAAFSLLGALELGVLCSVISTAYLPTYVFSRPLYRE